MIVEEREGKGRKGTKRKFKIYEIVKGKVLKVS